MEHHPSVLSSFAYGSWLSGSGEGLPIYHAATGEHIYQSSSRGLDFADMLSWGRSTGGTALRAMTFHERARRLKQLAQYLLERKEEFYRLSEATGATRKDSWIDIEGGIGTLFTYASKGRRELPDEPYYIEGEPERISKNNTFTGQHICVPLKGVAVHINAFNFPCWGMLEKLAPTFLAGMPAIVKPASVTSYLTRSMVAAILESKILPEGSLQVICGGVGDLFNHLTSQDVVTFTGSKETGISLKAHPRVVEQSVRFNLEADSLNCAILGPDAGPGTEEFDLFIAELVREMTVKAGQKCTAIRRAIVPGSFVEEVIKATKAKLDAIPLGDPAHREVKMGPVVSKAHVEDLKRQVAKILQASEAVVGQPDKFNVLHGDPQRGAFFPALLLACENPLSAPEVHQIEAFGPVSTVMPYETLDEAIEIARLGEGSLCGSIFTADDRTAKKLCLGIAPYHGRLLLMNAYCSKESTGHGSPLPHLVHGGPGRAGGGEELGGIRSVLHYMQRTALQGSPERLSVVCNRHLPGSAYKEDRVHPFRKYFDELQIGESWLTHRRTVTETDVVNFAAISGDHFYAHTDDIAARESMFQSRVVHGYFVLSAAAGLFVDPAPGPVLANYGLDNLRFIKPVYIGDTIQVRLTCAEKTPRDDNPEGVVAWMVEVFNQAEEVVANYKVLTLVKRLPPGSA